MLIIDRETGVHQMDPYGPEAEAVLKVRIFNPFAWPAEPRGEYQISIDDCRLLNRLFHTACQRTEHM